MVSSRRKHDIRLRKRREEEGEDDEGSIVPAAEDDSMSEESASDADEDGDGDVSETTDLDIATTTNGHATPLNNGYQKQDKGGQYRSSPRARGIAEASAINDTNAMMNGLQVTQDEHLDEGINFDELQESNERVSAGKEAELERTGKPTSIAEQRRQDHEEYKRKRDADPAFVPNRGGFFMHDQRNSNGAQTGSKPNGGKTRGKGRATFAGVVGINRYLRNARIFGVSTDVHNRGGGPSDMADTPWTHDLHDSIKEPAPNESSSSRQTSSQPIPPKQPNSRQMPAQLPNRTFSKTVRVGTMNIRVFLQGMEDPIVFSAVPAHQHTRLPHHRPPLRRDKPMRVSLPSMPIRYIFPSVERSFIFIPRAMRPNQQGFGRLRGRNSFSGGLGALSSRRTSIYAASNYTPSLAHSRRSSTARDTARDGFISPTIGTLQRPFAASLEPGKPVVRLPPAIAQLQEPEPEAPTLRENRAEALPMHQPRPQKTVVVADIEAPTFNPPQQQQQQPFHQQMPAQIADALYPSEVAMYPYQHHPSHPSQVGTPLTQIPERAIHAQPFQPYGYPPAPGVYYPPYPPPFVYYPPMEQEGPSGPPGAAPVFIPGQPFPYAIPYVPPPPPTLEPTTQAGTVAHESNGMVFYYDSSQVPTEVSAPAAYPLPGYRASGAGAYVANGMMTSPASYAPPAPPPTSSSPAVAPQ